VSPGLAVVIATLVAAATPTQPLEVGQRIRVTAPTLTGGERVEGILHSLDDEVLEIDVDQQGTRLIRRTIVTGMEVRIARRRNTVKGLVLGTLAGLFVLPLPFERANTTRALTVAGALGGAALGTLVKTEQWQALPLDPAPRTRRLGASFTFQF
jgi:hypothetical protein